MPGRPLLDNDKKDKVVSTYLSEEESKKLDDYIKDNYISSRAWFIRMLIFAKMELPNQHQCDFLHRNRKLGIETIYIQLE